MAFHCYNGLNKEKLQRQFAPSAIRGLWKGPQELGSFLAVSKCLQYRQIGFSRPILLDALTVADKD